MNRISARCTLGFSVKRRPMIQKPTVGSALCPAISVLYYLPLTAVVRSVLVHFVTVGSARQPIKGEIVMNDGLFDVIVFSNCQDPG